MVTPTMRVRYRTNWGSGCCLPHTSIRTNPSRYALNFILFSLRKTPFLTKIFKIRLRRRTTCSRKKSNLLPLKHIQPNSVEQARRHVGWERGVFSAPAEGENFHIEEQHPPQPRPQLVSPRLFIADLLSQLVQHSSPRGKQPLFECIERCDSHRFSWDSFGFQLGDVDSGVRETRLSLDVRCTSWLLGPHALSRLLPHCKHIWWPFMNSSFAWQWWAFP